MSACAYRPHRAWESPLYHAVAGNLATFLAGRQLNGRPVPFFIVRDFRAYLDCGVPAHGFLRVHCDDCGRDRIVPFSCKGRGFCPSCCGRRMADTAARLVDETLPEAPVRQAHFFFIPLGLRPTKRSHGSLAALPGASKVCMPAARRRWISTRRRTRKTFFPGSTARRWGVGRWPARAPD